MKIVYNIYKKHLSESGIANIAIPAGLGAGLFIINFTKETYPLWISLPVGTFFIGLTSTHAYIIKKIADEKTKLKSDNESDLLKMRALVEVTNALVDYKRAKIPEFKETKKRFEKCIAAILMALCDYYEKDSQNVYCRAVFFLPQIAPDKKTKYLYIYDYYNKNYIAPKSFSLTTEALIKSFEYNNDKRMVCKSWRDGSMVIVEDAEKEGLQLEENEKSYFKSMLSYPIKNPSNHEVNAVVSIVADRVNFFEKTDASFHSFIFEHFAARINLEFADLQLILSKRRKKS